ncbi:MAG: ribulose-phosphate 3-epimerase [Solirubrobacteraceae bacterium]|nr:ribulose-phosphate 3-epimerase [Solirubrobacteraceae bacterium]MDP4672224.1 ribulose-phosphate 3-epimerase [Solirubrobacteraceae bacterium]MDP4921582.1 ribulose-phosphate 3-epimerase [Solirubrobacteraceae bacterium]MDP5033862.1 ribulose-phosphate 3-epimerase [Solirubrobacteraceae bacterium]
MTIEIAPSILSADFGILREQVQLVEDAGARIIHVDVMDGQFVPPLSMGPQVCEALRDMGLHLEVHLMVDRPETIQVETFAAAGAGTIIIHAEATPAVDYALELIRSHGCKAGLAVNPATPLSIYEEIEPDLALCMTVNPGWGGQSFIASSIEKITRLRAIVGDEVVIEVDGGVDARTAGLCVAAGASRLVAGSAIFGQDDPARAFNDILNAATIRN